MKRQQFSIFNKCQALILDMDGVIVDSEPVHGESFRMFLEDLKLPFTEKFVSDLVGHSVNHNIKTINETYLKYRPMKVEDGVRIRDALYLDLITSRPLNPIDGIESLLTLSKKAGLKLGLASSSAREQIEAILLNLTKNSDHGVNFQKLFDVTVAGDEVANKKPAPDLYRQAVQTLGVSTNHCIAIEDSGAGIMSAKKSKLFCIALRNQYLKEEEAKGADLIINSIHEIIEMLTLNPDQESV
jgi:HAD superfamily hydrolase (TIGR01509 family)